MNRSRISALLMITAGAVLGYVAASSGPRLERSASAADSASPVAVAESPQATCSSGVNKGILLALAGPPRPTATARAQENAPTKRPNIVTIMSDDVGWFNIGAYHRGIM